MAWIESHQNLERHPKTIFLSVRMGWGIEETIGRLHKFWWWVLDFAPTGDLSKYGPGIIASAFGVPMSADMSSQFVSSLAEVGWLDRGSGVLRVHDWPRYAGRYLRDTKFKRSPKEWEAVVALYEIPCDPAGYNLSADMSEEIEPMSAVPNQPTNQPNQPPAEDKSAAPPVDIFDGMPSILETEAFKSAWLDYVAYRITAKLKPLKPLSVKAQWQEFTQWGEERAIQAIRDTIRQGWQGIFEPKSGGKTHGKISSSTRNSIIGATHDPTGKTAEQYQ